MSVTLTVETDLDGAEELQYAHRLKELIEAASRLDADEMAMVSVVTGYASDDGPKFELRNMQGTRFAQLFFDHLFIGAIEMRKVTTGYAEFVTHSVTVEASNGDVIGHTGIAAGEAHTMTFEQCDEAENDMAAGR